MKQIAFRLQSKGSRLRLTELRDDSLRGEAGEELFRI